MTKTRKGTLHPSMPECMTLQEFRKELKARLVERLGAEEAKLAHSAKHSRACWLTAPGNIEVAVNGTINLHESYKRGRTLCDLIYTDSDHKFFGFKCWKTS